MHCFYVISNQHLGSPNVEDVREGLISYIIVPHAADIARHRPGVRDSDDMISRAC